MKAQVIKSTTFLDDQVIIIGQENELHHWWNTIAVCILERIKYCQENNLENAKNELWTMFHEIENQLKEGE